MDLHNGQKGEGIYIMYMYRVYESMSYLYDENPKAFGER